MEKERNRLLAWYDAHRRALPWRAERGEPADPYRVWLSEIMLQQTTVRAVAPYFERFTKRWPDVRALARAPLEEVLKEWAGLGYYARARNLHACARTVAESHGGRFPLGVEGLRTLPGVGVYTAAAVAAIAFGRPCVPVDGNVERVLARYFAIAEPLPAAKREIAASAASLAGDVRAGDFAQALMDLGAMICTPKRPACALCPWREGCAALRMGLQDELPRKAEKAERPVRYGAAFWAEREDGAVLVRTRPEKGLLGGMTEIPSGDWLEAMPGAQADLAAAPLKARWRRLPGGVRHVFTHFALELVVFRAEVGRSVEVAAHAAPERCAWVHKARLGGQALPTVMRKVAAHALADQGEEGLLGPRR